WVEPDIEQEPTRRDVAEIVRVPQGGSGALHRPSRFASGPGPDALERSAVGEPPSWSGEQKRLRTPVVFDLLGPLPERDHQAGWERRHAALAVLRGLDGEALPRLLDGAVDADD